jgi:hypothetical protein
MPPPVYNVGQIIDASDVNNWFLPLAKYKPASTSRTTTTRSNDPDLVYTGLTANAVYSVSSLLTFNTLTASGVGFAFGFTSWGTIGGRWSPIYRLSGDTALGSNGGPAGCPDLAWTQYCGAGGQVNAGSTPGDNANHAVLIKGTLITGASPGTFALSWAQDTSNATALTLNLGSNIILQRIS